MFTVPESRRKFLQALGVAAAGLPLSLSDTFAGSGTRKPNVLFIAVDDLNDWIGSLGGHPDVKTPNLDRLAKRGVLFANAHCPGPACNPSRTALMTGILPSTSGIYTNSQPWRKSPVLTDAVTLPQHFMAHGYRVIGGGKLFHGRCDNNESWHLYQRRFRHPMPPDSELPLNGMGPPSGMSMTKGMRKLDWGPLDIDDSEMSDWNMADWAINQLRENHNSPFFLGCGFVRPHLSWYVPRKYFDIYDPNRLTLPATLPDDLDDIPRSGRNLLNDKVRDHERIVESGQWKNAVHGYLAAVSFADACVGRLIDALDASPYRANTIVVLWSDHGWHLGEKGMWRKFTLWEDSTRIPLMIVAPGVTEPGGRCREPVNLVDIFPTLIELCDLAPLDALDGHSLLPQLSNPNATAVRPALTTLHRGDHSLRSRRWRYIRYSNGSEELYDHDVDEHEWMNLAHDSRYRAVKQELAQWLPTRNARESVEGEC